MLQLALHDIARALFSLQLAPHCSMGRHRGAARAVARQQSPTALWTATWGVADCSGVPTMPIALESWTGGLGLTTMQDD